MNIYVGNLSREVTENELRELFETKGTVTSVKVMIDRLTGQKRGFGFVEMPEDEAKQAIEQLNGYQLKGQALRVNEARPPEDRPRTGGYGQRDNRGGGYGQRDNNRSGFGGFSKPKRF